MLAAEPKAVSRDFCELRQEQDPGGGTTGRMTNERERALRIVEEYILNPENAETIREMIEQAEKKHREEAKPE
jgi:hypothetical protein